ncbi:hypothetical protein [Treponema primitia]
MPGSRFTWQYQTKQPIPAASATLGTRTPIRRGIYEEPGFFSGK